MTYFNVWFEIELVTHPGLRGIGKYLRFRGLRCRRDG